MRFIYISFTYCLFSASALRIISWKVSNPDPFKGSGVRTASFAGTFSFAPRNLPENESTSYYARDEKVRFPSSKFHLIPGLL